jgi:DNA-binding SARP family transcriptional activator
MGSGHGHGLVAVGPGLAGSMLLAGGYGLNPLPVQPAKIHCPPPRDDTLSRERLNSWLERAASGRLALIVAEAGFGKTTLLADWALHTGRMTAWYRLEQDDRDWLTFIRHIVASVRELDPEFAPETFGLLLALGSGGPTQQDLVASLAREVAAFGVGSTRGLTLILDDYHVVDGFEETEPIVRALLDRTAPGFSVVISTRSMPRFPIGRLRARGGVMTLEGAELCFDIGETTRLFRDAYHRPLDEDVVSDLFDRTEGWAALLTLVRTGLDDRGHNDPRVLVAHLDASRGDLYDFLAEEVLATLSPDLQHFLTRVALLMSVDVERARLVHDRPAEDIAAALAECERLGLLTRPDRESPHRFHPLVREFLVAHLTAEIGEAVVRELHGKLGREFETRDWLPAAWHYRQAGDPDSAARVLDAAIPDVLAAGHFEHTRQFLDGTAGSPDRAGGLVLRTRLELERGNSARALELAQLANLAAEDTSLAGLALLNLTAARARHGFDDLSIELASKAMSAQLAPSERQIAEASIAVWSTQAEGNLAAVADYLTTLAFQQDQVGHVRYAGVTRLNLAVILLWLGRNRDAAAVAQRAEVDLNYAPSGPERVAALAVRAAALVQLGYVDELRRLDALVDTASTPMGRDEAAIEAARLHADYGSVDRAQSAADRVGPAALGAGYLGGWAVLSGILALRRGEAAQASEYLLMSGGRLQDAAGKFRIGVLAVRISLATGSDAVHSQLEDLARIAVAQCSRLEDLTLALLRGLTDNKPDPAINQLMPDETHLLSTLAEEMSRSLPNLGDQARARVRQEAILRPDRWSTALRMVFLSDPIAAQLLADIGDEETAGAIRAAATHRKWLRPIAATITRRLAPPVLLRDLGPVSITIGADGHGRSLRRKVLGLLCFVSSRPGMAATRDEALEAIWPDLGPDTAVNSLHQTIYYLRRIFEPGYKEGMSAGYVAFDGDVLALDGELVDSLSRRCWCFIALARNGDEDALRQLLGAYCGTYALDFAYEEWAAGYRENLHAAVLGAAETGVRAAIERRDIDTAIEFAHSMLAVDPAADAIELELLRAYKVGGRHAAAAEQYAHYAAYMRGELGTEPPTFGEI